ncbi:MAG: STAS domain-containing protein [Eggerthellaceae bacterium]|nr:STAS domain-containing protein [Eggerthellaceae bacterium]
MAIAKTVDGTKATLAIDGWLDTQSAPELAAALDELDEGVEELVLDLAALEYVSSAGIRQIVAAHKKTGGKLIVRNVSPEVLEVFRLTGVDGRLNIE